MKHKGREYRQITMGTLDILSQLEAQTGRTDIQSMLEFLVLHSTPIKDVRAARADGTWDDMVAEYGDTLQPADMQKLLPYMEKEFAKVQENMVEPKADSNSRKK